MALSPALRYPVYAAGVILAFFLAAGAGAAAAVVVDWQLGRAVTGPVHTSPSESGKSETTGATRASEDTASEAAGSSKDLDQRAHETPFIHRATDENSRGDYTYIANPNIDGDPDAVVLVSLASGPKSAGTASYGHNIGVWYEPVGRKWAIFNQDRAVVPAGSTFEVEVPSASTSFVHRADLLHTAGNYTYLDNPLTNGEPDAVLSVTQNWNPGGGRGVYNNHPVGTLYDAKLKKWAVFNRDGAPMPKGAAFNIAVSAGAMHPAS